MNKLFARIVEFYSSRTERERWIILAGTAISVLIILYLMLSPFLGHISKLDRMISDKREELLRVMELKAQYGDSLEPASDIKILEKSSSLLAIIEGITTRIGITIQSFRPGEGIVHEKYKEVTAEIKMTGLNLQQLTEFLYFLEQESRYSIKVKKFYSKTTFKDPNKIDATIVIGAFQYI